MHGRYTGVSQAMRHTLPVVFLDLDGVANSDPFLQGVAQRYPGKRPLSDGGPQAQELLDPELVGKLNALVGKVDFVLSSGWGRRFTMKEVEGFLRECGWAGHLAGITPKRFSSTKVAEVAWYLEDHPEAVFALLDDEDVFYHHPHLHPRLVQTNPEVGVTDADLARVAEMLGVRL